MNANARTPLPWEAKPVDGTHNFREPTEGDYYLWNPETKICIGILWAFGEEGDASREFLLEAVNEHDSICSRVSELEQDAQSLRELARNKQTKLTLTEGCLEELERENAELRKGLEMLLSRLPSTTDCDLLDDDAQSGRRVMGFPKFTIAEIRQLHALARSR